MHSLPYSNKAGFVLDALADAAQWAAATGWLP